MGPTHVGFRAHVKIASRIVLYRSKQGDQSFFFFGGGHMVSIEPETSKALKRSTRGSGVCCANDDAAAATAAAFPRLPRLLELRYLTCQLSWWRGTVVERRSLAGELSLSCARPAADG